MKIIFNTNKAEMFEFTSIPKETMIYITNPFKFGFGFKQRIIHTNKIFKGDYQCPLNGEIVNDIEYYRVQFKTLRFKYLGWNKKFYIYTNDIEETSFAKYPINFDDVECIKEKSK